MDSSWGGPVNIGSDVLLTINQLAEMIIEISGKDLTLKHVSGPLGVRGRNSDNRLIEEQLGWRPSALVKDGLRLTYDWIEHQVAKSRAVVPRGPVGNPITAANRE